MTSNKSANNLLNKKDRTLTDYLKLFNTRNFNFFEETPTQIYPIPNTGYKRLYNLNKLNKEKEEDYRNKILKQRELNELSECSFFPKTNKDFEYKKENIFNNINFNNNTNNQNLFTDKSSFDSKNKNKSEVFNDSIISDLLKRQEEWLKKKNKKMEMNKQLEKNRVNKKLVFSPEINKTNLDYMKINAQEIVEDPESYKEFIDRNKKNNKLLEINNNNKIRYSWNKNNNSINSNKYDYTEHKLINKNILSNKFYRNSKSVDIKKIKEKKNFVYNKSKINDLKNNDDIYSLLYRENKEKYENRINEGFNEQDKKNIFNGKTQIEFKEALDILHDKLINFFSVRIYFIIYLKKKINLDIFDESDDDNLEKNYHKKFNK